jgi:hypothetical protein
VRPPARTMNSDDVRTNSGSDSSSFSSSRSELRLTDYKVKGRLRVMQRSFLRLLVLTFVVLLLGVVWGCGGSSDFGIGNDSGPAEGSSSEDTGTHPRDGGQSFPDSFCPVPDTGHKDGTVGGDGGTEGGSGPFTIGGTVSGLAGMGLVLVDNGGDDLPIGADGSFTFPTPLANGATYAVTVSTPPSMPAQTCAITKGTGKVKGADVTTVNVACTTSTFTISGTLSGLSTGNSLTLQDNLSDNLPLTTNGSFTFSTSIASSAPYKVTVLTQPTSPAETCYVSAGTGTVGSADVTGVIVTCAPPGVYCGRFTSGYTGAWTTATANPFSTTMGMAGYLPSGGTATMYLNDGTSFDEYDTSSNTYSALAAPPVAFPSYGSTAFANAAIWSIATGDVISFDLASSTWTTAATGLTVEQDSQTTSDDAGNLWSYSTAGELLAYNIAAGTTTTYTLTTPLTNSFDYDEPRIVFDSCSGLLYLTDYSSTPLYSYDPASGTQTTLSSLPLANDFQDGFCGDRSGHLFAVTDTDLMYQYTIATDTWVAMPTGGPTGDENSACGVGADGFLYATDPAEGSTMYRIQLN